MTVVRFQVLRAIGVSITQTVLSELVPYAEKTAENHMSLYYCLQKENYRRVSLSSSIYLIFPVLHKILPRLVHFCIDMNRSFSWWVRSNFFLSLIFHTDGTYVSDAQKHAYNNLMHDDNNLGD